MKMAFKLFSVVLCSFSAVFTAVAEQDPLPFYAGVSVGSSDYDLNDDYTIRYADSVSKSESNTSFGLVFGLGIFPFLDAELYYQNLADFSYNTENIIATSPPNRQSGSQDIAAYGLNFVLKKQLRDRFTGFIKLGLYSSSVDTTDSREVIGEDLTGLNYNRASSYSKSGGVFGLGGEVSVRDPFSIRIGYTRYLDIVKTVDASNSTISSLSNVSLDFVYKF